MNANVTLALDESVTLQRSQRRRICLIAITYWPVPLLNKFRFKLLEDDVVSHAVCSYWNRGSTSPTSSGASWSPVPTSDCHTIYVQLAAVAGVANFTDHIDIYVQARRSTVVRQGHSMRPLVDIRVEKRLLE